MSMALSLALHGLALVPLMLAGMAGSSASDEPAFMVELSLAAPTQGPVSEPEAEESAEPPQPPEPETPAASIEQAAASLPPPEPQPEIVLEAEIRVELPPPQEVPAVQAAELKPADPPKPQPKPKPKPPAARPPAPRPNAASAWTHAPAPDTGNAGMTRQASASSAIVFDGKPRYRLPPTPPAYPQRSIELNQQGEALVRVRLDPDGSVAEILLWRSSGFPLLDRAALAAVRGWHFFPAVRDGRPVAAWVEIPVRFHLR